MNAQLIEIASWRLVSELHRRYPEKFKIIETHPGGGIYDCLTLIEALIDRKQRHIADFNRVGRFHVFNRFDDKEPKEPFHIWPEMLRSDNPIAILDRVSDLLGLQVPSTLPSSTPTTLVYRFISAFLNHFTFGKDKWECRNGYFDSSDILGSYEVSDFEYFSLAQQRLRSVFPDDVLEQPAYRFWFLRKDEKPMLCLETTGVVWNLKGASFNLIDLYKKSNRIWPVVYEVAGDYLP